MTLYCLLIYHNLFLLTVLSLATKQLLAHSSCLINIYWVNVYKNLYERSFDSKIQIFMGATSHCFALLLYSWDSNAKKLIEIDTLV